MLDQHDDFTANIYLTLVQILTFAPLSSNALTISVWPLFAASCKAVYPYYDNQCLRQREKNNERDQR